jgi:ribulose-5-phosphate 4-epimerase/fuculose-1-phosphate aldolase
MPSTTDPRPLMVEIAHLLYSRFLTNSAGGNMSCRVGERIYLTPRGLGSKRRWQLREEMVLVFDADLNPLEGDPRTASRESRMHFACYRRFPELNGVIHAHPRYLSVFAAAGKPVTPTSEYTEKFGPVEVVPPLPSQCVLHRAFLAATPPGTGAGSIANGAAALQRVRALQGVLGCDAPGTGAGSDVGRR